MLLSMTGFGSARGTGPGFAVVVEEGKAGFACDFGFYLVVYAHLLDDGDCWAGDVDALAVGKFVG